MIYNIKKKDYDVIIKGLIKCLKIGDGLIFSGDCIHPILSNMEDDVLSTNGTTTIKSFLPFILPEGVTMITVMNISDVLTLLKDKKGMKRIYMAMDDNTIRINTDGDEIIIATTNKAFNGQIMTKTYSDFNTFVNIVDFDDTDNDVSKELTDKELIRIRDSKPVTLESEYGKVRISKNLFSLVGPMQKNKPVTAFSACWSVRHVINEEIGLDDYVLALHVKYKDIEAIHLYSVSPF